MRAIWLFIAPWLTLTALIAGAAITGETLSARRAWAGELDDAQAHAAKIQDVLAAKDDAAAKKLITSSAHDPWLIVEVLADKGAHETAGEFIKHLPPSPDTASLLDYATTRKKPLAKDEESALAQILRHQEAALHPPKDVSAHKHVERLMRVADQAQALGWLTRAQGLLAKAHRLAHEAKDPALLAPFYEQYLILVRQRKDQDAQFFLGIRLATAYVALSKFDPALVWAKRSLELAAVDERRVLALRMVLRVEIRRGDNTEVIRLCQKLKPIEIALGHASWAAACDIQWAMAESVLGRSAPALARVDAALRALETLGSKAHIWDAHLKAANIAHIHSDYNRVLHHVHEADKVSKGLNVSDVSLRNLEASALRRFGKLERAQGILESVLKQLPRDNVTSKASTLFELIAIACRRKATQAASDHLKALERLTEEPTASSSIKALLTRIEAARCLVSLAKGAYSDAIAAGKRALNNVVHSDELQSRASFQTWIARAYVEMDKPLQALPHTDELMASLITRSGTMHERTGSLYRNSWRNSSRFAFEAAGRAKDAARLFRYSETACAMALRGRIATEGTSSHALTAEERLRKDTLGDTERRAVRRLRQATKSDNAKARSKAYAQLQDARVALERHQETVRARQVIAGQLLFPVIDRLSDLQKRIRKDASLVLMCRGVTHLFALVVDAEQARIVHLGSARAIESSIATLDFSDALAPWTKEVAALRTAIAEPLALGDTTSNIAVVALGSLAKLPYSLLWPTKVIRMLPSATVDRLLASQPGKGTRVLALADPQVEGMPRLPGTRREAKAIGQSVLIDTEASEERLAAMLKTQPRWRAVHLACHAAIDMKNPLRSALMLSPSKESDGLWTVSEILGAQVPTELAVLAACSTGQRSRRDEEGAMGFAHALFVAGARRVIVSLWDVNDDAASALFARMYNEWKPGTPPALALARAQAWMRGQKKWSHPAHWASWQIWGPR